MEGSSKPGWPRVANPITTNMFKHNNWRHITPDHSTKKDLKEAPTDGSPATDSNTQALSNSLIDSLQFFSCSSTVALSDFALDLKNAVEAYRKQIFENDKDKVKIGYLVSIECSLGAIAGHVLFLDNVAPLYDLSPEAPGNGYRSLLHTTAKYLNRLVKETGLNRSNTEKWWTLFNKQGISTRVAEVYANLLDKAEFMLKTAVDMHKTNTNGADTSLFSNGMSKEEFQSFLDMDMDIFYGDHFGLQEVRGYLGVVRMTMQPELRAKRLTSQLNSLDVNFVKLLWNQTENALIHDIASLGSPMVAANKMLRIPCVAFDMVDRNGNTITIEPPKRGSVFSRVIKIDNDDDPPTDNQNTTDNHTEIGAPPSPRLHSNRGGLLGGLFSKIPNMPGMPGSSPKPVRVADAGVEQSELVHTNGHGVLSSQSLPSACPAEMEPHNRRRASAGPDIVHSVHSVPFLESSEHTSHTNSANTTTTHQNTHHGSLSPRAHLPSVQENGHASEIDGLKSPTSPSKQGDVFQFPSATPLEGTNNSQGNGNSGGVVGDSEKERRKSGGGPPSASPRSGRRQSYSAQILGGLLSPNDALESANGKEPKGFLFHIHGGGFIAQTSKSHAPYLKDWAKELRMPILSIDYTLSPEVPFGPALEECYYGYCWAIKNAALLGIVPDTVCVSGDSAGGNLTAALTIRILESTVRIPKAIQCNYPALHIRLTPSPARLLAAGDALLAMGALRTCLQAYGGPECELADPNTINPLLSPWHVSDEILARFPPTYMVCGAIDPLLDDGVDFARKLKAVGVPVDCQVMPCVSHAFLQLIGGGKYVSDAYKRAKEHVCLMYGIDRQAVASPSPVQESTSGELARP